MEKKTKNIVISGTNFWNPGDDFVREGTIKILKRLFREYTVNLLFYNFNADYFPLSKFSGISNTIAKGDIEKYRHSIDAVVVAGLSAGLEIKDLYNWVIANSLQDRVYLIGAGYENNYVGNYIYEEPEATIFKNAQIIIGRTRKTPKFIPDLNLPYYHINCPSILSVDNVKNIPLKKTIEKIVFSIQLPHEIGIPNQCCDKSMYELAVSILCELSRKYAVEVIAHHKSEYFHFLDALKDFDIPVIFSSFYHDLFEIYPRYDLVITTRLHSSLFANGHGIPGVIINDTDRHTHTLEGFPHSVWVNDKDKFYQALDAISEIGLHKIVQDADKYKSSLLKRYVQTLSKAFGVNGNERENSREINNKTNGLSSYTASEANSTGNLNSDCQFDSEISEQILVRSIVKNGMIVFDIGANVGKYTKLFSQLVGEKGKVYAFEPSQNTFNRLTSIVHESWCSNVELFPKAVYSENTKVILNEFPDPYCSWNTLGKPLMEDPKNAKDYVPIRKSIEVEAVTLDSFCKENHINRIDYLKLDVEGAEVFALEGALELLKNKVIRYLQFEISQKMLEGLNTKARYVFDLLIANGYECHTISKDGTIGGKVIDSDSFYENYIAFPANHQKSITNCSPSMPIHFFTIVLNGEPFIHHHVEVFRQLPFNWHWHIIEGIADLKHDTAWCLQFGGRITGTMHQNGLSNDGTTEYLDELKKQYPENVTIYRKPNDAFWDGKLEMVNAPLVNINQECLLWQVDADELWTVEQICTMRSLFIQHPNKTAAYFLCRYFVGENLVITTRDTYGNHTSYEWLRTWRFEPGFRWTSHEPPRLCQQTPNGQWVDIATLNPFVHHETEEQNIIFQHFAYVAEGQIRFKEGYYGYENAVGHWKALQNQSRLPVWLRDYFPWVKDAAQVNTAQSQNILPIAQKSTNGQWHFKQHDTSTDAVQNVLWIRTDSIGDNVLASSMLPYIHEKYKNASITVVCQEHIAELYESCPYVSGVIRYNKSLSYEDEQYRTGILQKLRSLNVDCALNSVYSREPLTDAFTIGSGAKETIAFNGNLCNISDELRNRHNQFYTRLLKSETEHKPELERHRDYLNGIGIEVQSLRPNIWLTTEDEEFAEEYFRKNNLSTKNTIALFAGAQCGARFYRKYGTAISHICRDNQFTVIALGAECDYAINQVSLDQIGVRAINLSGKTTIRQTAALLKRCKASIGAETGTAHIACAVGTPNIIMLGGGHFGRFMPYSPLTSVVCLPLECYGCNWKCKYQTVHCVCDIYPEVVAEAVQHTLKNTSEKPRIFVQGNTLWNQQANQPKWEWFDRLLDVRSVKIIPIGDTPSFINMNHKISDIISLPSIDILNLQAKHALQNGDVPNAKELLTKVLNQSPNNIKALNNLAVIEILEENWKSAQEVLQKVHQLDPSNKTAYENNKSLNNYRGLQESQKTITIPDKMAFPKISVVTPSFNQARYIEQTIKSVQNQDYPDYEHIIIDGGSDDGSVEILKRYSHIKWISEVDKGQSDAVNKGLRMATGDIIAWINSDDWYELGSFRVVAEFFINNPDKNVVMGDCNLVDEKGIIFDKVINYERGFNVLKNYHIGRSIPTQPAIFFRRRLLAEFGYLDETLHYAMDYDLWLRFALKNRFYHINQTFANYRFHAAAKGGDQDWSKFVPECKIVSGRYTSSEKVLPRVSVIIPCYNQAQFLTEAVESVVNQSFTDWECIIVNDGSPDYTSDIARQIVAKYPDKRIGLIEKRNGGISDARNTGIKNSKGKYILPLDADDSIHPKMLEKAVSLLEAHPEIAIAYTDVKHFGVENRIVYAGEYDFKQLSIQNHLNYCALFKREAWESTGGYNSNMHLGYEDWDFWISCGEKGFYGKRIPEPLFMYRVKKTSRDTKARKHHSELVAQIVLNHQNLYSKNIIDNAKSIIEKCSHKKLTFHPLVSVIVPTYNRPDTLKTTLDSIAFQTYKNVEVILVNDAGEDVSDIVKSYHDRISVNYILHSRNKGLAASRNAGISAAKGKYIAYLDDDDIFYEDHVETLVNLLETSDYKIAYTDAYRAYQEKENGRYVSKRKDIPYSFDFDPDLILAQNIFPVLCIMHEKSCLDEVGVFDESLTTHEDWDLWIRMSRKYNFAHIEKITCEFAWRTDSTSMSSTKRADFIRTLNLIYEKYREHTIGKQRVLNLQAAWLKHLQKVSIIIPVFNKVELTRKCLEAIVKNTPKESYEVIIIDNASTDGTRDFLKCLEGDVKIITNDKNLGFSKACNQGARMASTEYLLFLNNDTEPSEGWLEPLLMILIQDNSVGAVGGKLLFPDGTIQHAGVVIFDDQKLPDPLVARHIYYGQPMDIAEANQLRQYQALTAACLLMRKSAFNEVGGFDEGYWNGYEDVDLCFKLQEKGWKLVYQPESTVIHHESKSGPERFLKVSENIQRLHSKWIGKIKPDVIIKEDGTTVITENNKIQRYYLPNSLQLETSDIKPQIFVSIIILTWNALEYTKKCVRSIQEHTSYPYEIIFADNASTDGTVEYLRNLVGEYSNYKLIENRENKGFATGNNQGVAAAQGEYVMLLNNDVLVSDGWLTSLVESLERNDKIGMTGPITNSISGRQMVRDVPYSDENGFHVFAKKVKKAYNGRLTPRYRIAGFAILMKKALYEEVGGFDESFGTGNYEDDDLCLKVLEKGYAIMVDESVFIHHYRSQTFIENKIDYRNSLSVNETKFKEKWPNINYEELLELHSSLVDANAALLIQGQQALDLGNINEGIALYSNVLNTNPIDESALYGIGLASQMNGMIDEAVDAYKKALKANPSFYNAYYSLALAYANTNQIDNAISTFKKALELRSDASAHNNLGVLYFKKNMHDYARISFEKALSIDVNYQEAQQNLEKINKVVNQA